MTLRKYLRTNTVDNLFVKSVASSLATFNHGIQLSSKDEGSMSLYLEELCWKLNARLRDLSFIRNKNLIFHEGHTLWQNIRFLSCTIDIL